MGKALLKVAEGYELIAAGLRELAEAQAKVPAEAPKKTAKKEEPKAEVPKEAAPKEAAPKEETPKEPEVDRITVKTYLTEKSRSGKTQEVRNLIVAMGYEKLTDVPDEKLAELYQKAQVL